MCFSAVFCLYAASWTKYFTPPTSYYANSYGCDAAGNEYIDERSDIYATTRFLKKAPGENTFSKITTDYGIVRSRGGKLIVSSNGMIYFMGTMSKGNSIYSGLSKSTNGGIDWTLLKSTAYPKLCVVDGKKVYFHQLDSYFYSGDDGVTWDSLGCGLMEDMKLDNTGKLWVLGFEKKGYRYIETSTDGKTFTKFSPANWVYNYGMAIASSTGPVYHFETSDISLLVDTTYSKITPSTISYHDYSASIATLNDLIVATGSYGGTIFHTTDQGKSWKSFGDEFGADSGSVRNFTYAPDGRILAVASQNIWVYGIAASINYNNSKPVAKNSNCKTKSIILMKNKGASSKILYKSAKLNGKCVDVSGRKNKPAL
jgi:photosystem II stability/assembly factor-like uncharacterized protein